MLHRKVAALALAGWLGASGAWAQSVQTVAPTAMGGQGNMSVGTSSVVLNAANVIKLGSSQPFPAATQPLPFKDVLFVSNQSANTIYFCWKGGTCTGATGYALTAGASRTVVLPDFGASPPTVIASGASSTLEVEW